MTVAVFESLNTHVLTDTTPFEVDHFREPESEIYGRSLGTIHRLGAFMVNALIHEAVNSPEADQARAEFYTSVEEGFGTDMELGGGLEVRDFDFRPMLDGKVVAKDLKTPVSGMTEAGLICAIEAAKKDERFLPQLIRSKWDHENALLVDSMARGETDYNTRIVISPFPEEAAEQSGDEYWRNIGYVPHLRRGFVQVYHANDEGVISGSLSFDGSDKEQLRKVFAEYGVEIPDTEVTDNWLQYAITATLSEQDSKELATNIANQAADPMYEKSTNTVDVTKEYGHLMDTVFNESYIHICESLFRGYQTPEARELIFQFADKASDFTSRYSDALYRMRSDENRFTDDDSVVLHELLVYSTIEMMRSLHLSSIESSKKNEYVSNERETDVAYMQFASAASFQDILSGFGAEGARHNRTYSACGLSISLGDNTGIGEANSPQNEYGGVDRTKEQGAGEEDDFGPLTFKCPKGHWNTRPRAKSPRDFLSNCKTCGTSLKC